jgi:hypothetical protein
MQPFEFVIAIVAIVLTYRAFALIFNRKQVGPTTTDREVEVLESRLSNLEERIGVLERIVTDDRSDLRRQFRDLE